MISEKKINMGEVEGEDKLDQKIQEYRVTLYRKNTLRQEFLELTKNSERLENELKIMCPHSKCRSCTECGSCAYEPTVTTYTCERCKLCFKDEPRDTTIVEKAVVR